MRDHADTLTRCGGRPLLQPYLDRLPGTSIYSFVIEAIGDNLHQHRREVIRNPRYVKTMSQHERRMLARLRAEADVRQVIGLKPCGTLLSVPLSGNRSFSTANAMGSRGIKKYYGLSQGPIYEVFAPETWSRSDHYFLRVIHDRPSRMSFDEVTACLAK